MLALSPPVFSTTGWPFEDTISLEQEDYILRENMLTTSESYSSIVHFSPPLSPSPPLQVDFDPVTPSTAAISCDPTIVRKINHNASERDRRKKINGLYSTLRSLLPASDQMKKLSIPATVTRVLKYIPELQRQVQNLVQQKEELLSRVNCKKEAHHQQTKRRSSSKLHQNHVVSASRLSDEDVVIHIVTTNNNNNIKVVPPPPGTAALSDVLLNLEKYRIPLVNASTFESLEGKVFYSLHVQVEKESGLECEKLTEMVLNMFEDDIDDKPQTDQGLPSKFEQFIF